MKQELVQSDIHRMLTERAHQKLAELIPDTIAPERAAALSRGIGELLAQNDYQKTQYLLFAGRLLHLAQKYPAIREAAKCKLMRDYYGLIDPTGKHESSIYAAASAYETFDDMLTPSLAAEIGAVNLTVATRAARTSAAGTSQRQEILDQAKALPTRAFRKYLEDKMKVVGKGGTEFSILEIRGTIEKVNILRNFLNMPAFAHFAESEHPVDMLIAAIENSMSDWAHPHTFITLGPEDNDEERVIDVTPVNSNIGTAVEPLRGAT